jgi:hypothetical protein
MSTQDSLRLGTPRRAGAGRAGRNRVGADVRALAQTHTPSAIETLVDVMQDAEAPAAARVMAANALLDRAHGKPPQAITGPNGGRPNGPTGVNPASGMSFSDRRLRRSGRRAIR